MKVSGWVLVICGAIILLLNVFLYIYRHSIDAHHILMVIIGIAMAVLGIIEVRRDKKKK
jgi:uncharacterized membrane protein HdeD (DUF308 family)